MDVRELIERWAARRKEILNTLPPKLLAEYRKLGALIRATGSEVLRSTMTPRPAPPGSGRFFDFPRIPLSHHKAKLVEFLKGKESATRGEIGAATGIPPGSLSKLLNKGKEFEQVKRGFWALKKGGK